jgi:hypothetical protein
MEIPIYPAKKGELDEKNEYHFFLRVKQIDIRTGNNFIIVINTSDANRLGIMPGDELSLS